MFNFKNLICTTLVTSSLISANVNAADMDIYYPIRDIYITIDGDNSKDYSLFSGIESTCAIAHRAEFQALNLGTIGIIPCVFESTKPKWIMLIYHLEYDSRRLLFRGKLSNNYGHFKAFIGMNCYKSKIDNAPAYDCKEKHEIKDVQIDISQRGISPIEMIASKELFDSTSFFLPFKFFVEE